MDIDVDRGSRTVVVNEGSREKHSADNESIGNNSGRGVVGCTSIGVNRLPLDFVFGRDHALNVHVVVCGPNLALAV